MKQYRIYYRLVGVKEKNLREFEVKAHDSNEAIQLFHERRGSFAIAIAIFAD